MSRFAPVAPIHILARLKQYGILGRYHLLLAHDVAAHPLEFGEVFFSHDNWNGGYIIMDNSLIELGEAADVSVVRTACSVVRPNVVVLPDKLMDTNWTVTHSIMAHDDWDKIGIIGRQGFMGVVQGTTWNECLICAHELTKLRKVTALAIPRVLTEKTEIQSRLGLAITLHKRYPEYTLHLLGFSDNTFDDLLTASLPFVSGIDSAVPLRIAITDGLAVSMSGEGFELLNRIGPRRGFWDDMNHNNDRALIHNLNVIRQYIGHVDL